MRKVRRFDDEFKREAIRLVKNSGHFLKTIEMKYEFIQLNRLEFPMKKMCRILKISRSGCYNWKNKKTI